MSDIIVTESMIDAAIERLNSLRAADARYETALRPWGEIVKEVYLAMETQRRQDIDEKIEANPLAKEMLNSLQHRYSNFAVGKQLRQKFKFQN